MKYCERGEREREREREGEREGGREEEEEVRGLAKEIKEQMRIF